MKYFPILLTFGMAVGGCAQLGISDGEAPAQDATTTTTATPPPAAGAATAEALDTTTPAQREAAAAPPPVGARVLGSTVVSLGSPSEPGFWLKTPLVDTEVQGQVTNSANGKTASVTLIPIEGAPTAGSRMSLPAMRLIGASLTDLAEVEVSISG